MKDEPEVREAAKADYGNINSDAPKGEMVKAGGTDIARLLEPGERVVWEGQSKPVGIRFSTGLFRPSNEPAATVAEIGHLLHNLGWGVIGIGWIIGIGYVVFNGVTAPHIWTAVLILAVLYAVGYITLQTTRNAGWPSSAQINRYWLTNRHAFVERGSFESKGYTVTR